MTATPFPGGTDSVRLIEYESARDDEGLGAWLIAPHVVQWWGTTTLASVTETPPDGGLQLIEVKGKKVGFIRWHTLTRAELDDAGLHEIPAGGVDFDIVIGEPDWLSRGVGSQALRLAIEQLERTRQPAFFTLCTSSANTRALRCYQRAGFAAQRSFPEAGEQYILLVRRGAAEPVSVSR